MVVISQILKVSLKRHSGFIMSPPPGGGNIFVVVGVVVCVIPCEHDNFWCVLNFTFKLEPYIDHKKVSEEFKN